MACPNEDGPNQPSIVFVYISIVQSEIDMAKCVCLPLVRVKGTYHTAVDIIIGRKDTLAVRNGLRMIPFMLLSYSGPLRNPV